MHDLEVVEICAGAGGQGLGLERAGFRHALAVELDPACSRTLRHNRPEWKVTTGDVADPAVWHPSDYRDIDLLAGGVPCPPFTVAGRQLGASDERDLFAWAVELCAAVRPRALLLENVRGLSENRFAGYRQHVLDRLRSLGYVPGWRLLQASDFGVPQLRPRTVLVALLPADAPWFRWPSGSTDPSGNDRPSGSGRTSGSGGPAPTVGETLRDLMAARGWPGADRWAAGASQIAPTIVGGSKKHGGPDLGPTRAKRAWAALGVDGMGIADQAPGPDEPVTHQPRLTCEMVARIQGWQDSWGWTFTGGKTARYRQIGNAFPPPVAEAAGRAIAAALRHDGTAELGGSRRAAAGTGRDLDGDPVLVALRAPDTGMVTVTELSRITGLSTPLVRRSLDNIERDFELIADDEAGAARSAATRYRLGAFKAFLGQADHIRHDQFAARPRTRNV